MPFVRFSRDKRGYEHFFLVQHVAGSRGKFSQHVLYWFRTPPNVKVGREPFDAAARQALEAYNPGIVFDWDSLRSTPIPVAQPEPWRERRRATRAARRVREGEGPEPGAQSVAQEEAAVEHVTSAIVPPGAQSAAVGQGLPPDGKVANVPRRRRRRRRRGGGHRGVGGGSAQAVPASQSSTVADELMAAPPAPEAEKPE